MENFFNYISNPLTPEDVDIWFRVNNIIPEKIELFSDFSHSLNILIVETYLGENNTANETKIVMSLDDNHKHFEWCWKKTVDSFKKEKITINSDSLHSYFSVLFLTEGFTNCCLSLNF